MGKPKSQSGKAKRLAKKKGLATTGAGTGPSYTVDELLDKAAELMEEYKYDLAQKFCQRALEQDSDHPRALEMTGNLLLELGQVEKAQQCLGRAIHVAPDSGHSKYLTAAQLFQGPEARDLYRRGIELLAAGLPSLAGQEEQAGFPSLAAGQEEAEARAELSTAYVALSELYMTDLCDEPEAESEARRLLGLATQGDPANPEGWQGLASLQLVVGETAEAAESMTRSLELWLPGHLAWARGAEGGQTGLGYNTRLGAVKLLLDLEQFDRAAEILDSLLEEDDEVVAPWYLHGWLNYLRDDPDFHGNVRHYLGRARQVHVMNPTDDEAMVQHITELLAEVGEAEPVEEAADRLDYTEENLERAEEIAGILDKDTEAEPEPMED